MKRKEEAKRKSTTINPDASPEYLTVSQMKLELERLGVDHSVSCFVCFLEN